MNREAIEKYQEILKKDPQSKAFAALADAYRELGMIAEAEKTARDGILRHPQYVSGHVVLGKILVAEKRWKEAELTLQKAVALGPENLLAHQLIGQVYLETKRPKEALKAYKLVLFLNPQSELAKKAVKKLETLSADDYDDDVFEMKKPDPVVHQPAAAKTTAETQSVPTQTASPTHGPVGKSKERSLALIDALIVRNNLERARDLLKIASVEYPDDLEIQERWELVAEEDELLEEAPEIKPDLSRKKFILNRKRQRLEFVLQRIKSLQLSPKN